MHGPEQNSIHYWLYTFKSQILPAMRHLFPLLGIVLLAACQSSSTYYLAQDTPPYQSHDLTAENLFSQNIEGPSFRHDTLFVVNYQHDGTIGMVFPDGHCELYVNLPDSSVGNSIKFDQDGNMYVADYTRHNILKIDHNKHISIYCHNDQFSQPNDICMTKEGIIFASDPNWQNNTGRIWRIDRDGKAVLVGDSLGTTNGITISPDEKHLYMGESAQRKIWRYDVDDAGNLSHKTLFTSFTDFGMDGMHFGPDGNLYICRYGKGVIAVFSTDGKMLREIPLKGKGCSNFVFGDPDGKTAFVTLQDRKCMEMFRID